MTHPALTAGKVAVITGGADGIGLAVAGRLLARGMRVAIADLPSEKLDRAAAGLTAHGEVLAVGCDVSDFAQVQALQAAAVGRFGQVDLLLNNAGVGRGGAAYERYNDWLRVLHTNLLGVLHGVQAFVPGMLAQGTPGLVVNTGSKQGITTPPGDTAYNVSKAGVKALTEGLAHSLRNEPGANLSAHLLIPGFTWTGIITGAAGRERPAGAWGPEQVADFLLEHLERGDFYVLCPDNDTPRALDEARMAWAMDDIVENRPALSRWHPEWSERFAAFVAGRT